MIRFTDRWLFYDSKVWTLNTAAARNSNIDCFSNCLLMLLISQLEKFLPQELDFRISLFETCLSVGEHTCTNFFSFKSQFFLCAQFSIVSPGVS
mmetsp:Transcript_5480/g.11250  ORF Transcript_5480/g.11250 Transcript_5480/m.11250 type:complete len:94 (-) Transcript_5480:952-1233(-)